MDTTVIERLARLRGIGDAYNDYRGDLRHISLKTKTDILRAMGCAVTDPTALAAELSELESARGTPIAARPGDGARRTHRRGLEHSRARVRRHVVVGHRAGVGRPARRDDLDGGLSGTLARRSRGFVDHTAAARPAGGSSARLPRVADHPGRGDEPLLPHLVGHRMFRARRHRAGWPALGRGRPVVHGSFPDQLGHRRFQRLTPVDPLAGAARRGLHRPESLACIGPGRSREVESLQRVEPAFPERALHRGAGRAGVRRMRRRMGAHEPG